MILWLNIRMCKIKQLLLPEFWKCDNNIISLQVVITSKMKNLPFDMTSNTTVQSKTRDLIVDNARRIFALQGKDGTTMADIALASGKSRRTLYTYFSNKDEVYLAVIENELAHLVERLQVVMNRRLTPERKLEEYIFTRFEAVKEAVERNGSLRADFFRNIYEVEKARRPIDVKEIRMIKQILDSGVEEGVFAVGETQWTAMMILYSLKGLEAPYLKESIGKYIKNHRSEIIKMIFNGLVVQR